MNTPTNNSDKTKILVKIGVQTMMWGSRLTTVRLKQVLKEIAETAKSVFPDIKEIGIEFGQKIHHLCHDIADNDIHEVALQDFFTEEEINNLTIDELYYCKKDVLRAEKLAGILQDSEFDGTHLPKLTLLGFSGRGSLKKRIDFCKILKKIKIQKDLHGVLTEIDGLIPRYFQIQQWCDKGYYKRYAQEATESIGVPLALHPFRFGPFDKHDLIDKQLREIDEELKEELNDSKVMQVQFVPDTAHLWLANMRKLYVPDAIKWIFENKLHRITAFHLKDWKRTFDSSLRYYSKGFTVLGGGDISKYADDEPVEDQRESDLGKFCREFEISYGGDDKKRQDLGKDKWVVFEQDFTIDNEKGTLQQSLEWFKKILGDQPVPLSSSYDQNKSEILPATLRFNEIVLRTANEDVSEKFDDRKRQVISMLHSMASDNSEQFVTILQDLCRYLFYGDRQPEPDTALEDAEDRPVYVALWEMSPRVSTMKLLNKEEVIVEGKPGECLTAKRSYKVKNDACTGFRVWKLSDLGEISNIREKEDERTVFFDAYNTTQERLKERFVNLPGEKEHRFNTILWIPICNTYNYNQIEARLGIFVNSEKLPNFKNGLEVPIDIKSGGKGYLHKLEEYLDDLVQNIGSALEKMWGNVAYQTTSELIEKVKGDQTSDAMLKKLIDELTSHFKLDGCFYYELSKEEDTLREYAPWSSDEIDDEFVECNEGDPGYQSKRYEDFWIGDDKEPKRAWMAFPIYAPSSREKCQPTSRDKNQEKKSPDVLGIFRCFRNNDKSFTSSDENTAHKMIADFVPLFLIRYISERRMRSISFIRHELRSPVGAIDVATGNIVKEMKHNSWTFSGNKDYGKDIRRYVKMMDSVLDNSFYLTGKEITMNFDSEKVSLIKDIVMPAINQGLYLLFADEGDEEASEKETSEMRRKISVFCNGYRRSDVPYDEVGVMRWNSILGHGPEPLYIDGPRLLHVFFNLLVNAIKYRHYPPRGGIEIYLNRLPYDSNSLYVNRAKMGPKGYMPEYNQEKWAVEILFCDEGLGVPEKCNELIFEDGFRASNIKNKFTGDGLGLWVCRKILQLHQSEISLVWNGGNFTPGKPTMFRILLDKSLKEPRR